MTNFSRIEMAFEIYKSMINNSTYYNVHTEDVRGYLRDSNDCSVRELARKAFLLADVFIEETKHQGNK